ncbi:hypothetical protein BDP27DRAFT_1405117 [Rhodocollybia butyracea]|uniref:Uncharacterized protein n=1 Tax=Rhodocollybia butyracea TaxID=206335 RepID=A0A9P5PJA0_9AGAR|nr:hypothetical protein BDP27DRAFT_1405117 [Rhodocollybia butyracea]
MSAGYRRCLQYRPADLLSVFWKTGHVAAPLQSSTVYWSKFAPSAERGILNDGQPGVQPPLPMPAPINNYVPFSERLLGGHVRAASMTSVRAATVGHAIAASMSNTLSYLYLICRVLSLIPYLIFGSESSTRDLAGSQDITRFERSSMACLLGEVAGTAVYWRYWLLSSSGSAAVNGCQRDYDGVISGLVRLS